MHPTSMDLPELLLRQCAAISPEPWYPSSFREPGVPPERLEAALDELRLAGLLHLTEWVAGRGRGYVLTPQGAQLLRNPGLIGRMRDGDILTPAEIPSQTLDRADPDARQHRAEAVMAALATRQRPRVTYFLLVITLIWFLAGMAIAQNEQVSINRYIGFGFGDAGVEAVRHKLGGLLPRDVIPGGQWWRLVSHAFVHGGLLNLLLGLYILYSLATQGESLWGRPRFLLLFFTCALGGGVATVLYGHPRNPVLGNGAALGGLISSGCVWLLLNWAYMPRDVAGSWLRSILGNVLFLVLISFLPGADMTDLIGGAVAGGVLAIPLVMNRFGLGASRLAGLVGAVAVPVLTLGLLLTNFEDVLPGQGDTQKLAMQADETSLDTYERVRGIYGLGPDRRKADADKLAAAKTHTDKAVEKLQTLEPKMSRGHAKNYVAASLRFFKEFQRSLDPNVPWTPADEEQLRKHFVEQEQLRSRWRNP